MAHGEREGEREREKGRERERKGERECVIKMEKMCKRIRER
jgi:hypothetical protein